MQFWIDGFTIAATPENLLFALIGCILGTIVGVLPGLGPAAATAILIPVTFTLDPVPAIIMLCAIYYGTQYGGTITSVLLNVPGESSTVITAIDGYKMARQGRAGAALGIAAAGSFIAGIIGSLGVLFLALPLARVALLFTTADTFALLVLAFTLIIAFRSRSILATVVVTLVGLLLATVGIDASAGTPRFTFGSTALFDGIDLVPVVMGLFGIAELLSSMEGENQGLKRMKVGSIFPTREDWRRSMPPILRGTTVGFGFGLLPGLAGIVPTMAAYALEKRVSKRRSSIGKGAIEGVATAEASNNAYAQSSLMPLLTLGIPGTATLAVLMGAFLINGIQPGPFLFRDHPEVVWPVIASFFIGNVILFILNFPLAGLWAKILDIPREYLYTGILLFCVVGAYSVRQSTFDIWLMLIFGIIGYVFRKIDWPVVPLIIALILGPQVEDSLRATLELSGGSASVFFTRPLSATLLGLAVTVLVLAVISERRVKGLAKPTIEAASHDTT